MNKVLLLTVSVIWSALAQQSGASDLESKIAVLQAKEARKDQEAVINLLSMNFVQSPAYIDYIHKFNEEGKKLQDLKAKEDMARIARSKALGCGIDPATEECNKVPTKENK